MEAEWQVYDFLLKSQTAEVKLLKHKNLTMPVLLIFKVLRISDYLLNLIIRIFLVCFIIVISKLSKTFFQTFKLIKYPFPSIHCSVCRKKYPPPERPPVLIDSHFPSSFSEARARETPKMALIKQKNLIRKRATNPGKYPAYERDCCRDRSRQTRHSYQLKLEY